MHVLAPGARALPLCFRLTRRSMGVLDCSLGGMTPIEYRNHNARSSTFEVSG
jgi:hypothetical protein